MADNTNSTTGDTYEDREARRRACLEHEKKALAEGEHADSLRNLLMRLVCVGRNVDQDEGDDMQPERALLRFASYTTKAVAIALAHGPMVEDDHDVELSHEEASMTLIGLSEILAVAPKLISDLEHAGVNIKSQGRSEVSL